MLQGQLLDYFEQRLHTLGMPVSVEFWNGRSVRLGDHPKFSRKRNSAVLIMQAAKSRSRSQITPHQD